MNFIFFIILTMALVLCPTVQTSPVVDKVILEARPPLDFDWSIIPESKLFSTVSAVMKIGKFMPNCIGFCIETGPPVQKMLLWTDWTASSVSLCVKEDDLFHQRTECRSVRLMKILKLFCENVLLSLSINAPNRSWWGHKMLPWRQQCPSRHTRWPIFNFSVSVIAAVPADLVWFCFAVAARQREGRHTARVHPQTRSIQLSAVLCNMRWRLPLVSCVTDRKAFRLRLKLSSGNVCQGKESGIIFFLIKANS